MGFVHLHVHTEYSPIDSLAKVKDLVAAVVADGNPAVAATDHGTLGALWKLNAYAKAAGIKAIPGLEAYLAIGSRFEKNAMDVEDDDADPDPDGGKGTKSKKYEHLTLLATTPTGWRNLVLMTNEAQESIWYKPRIDYDLLAEHAEGIIVLTGCLGGPIAGPLSRGDRDTAVANLRRLVECVGAENVFVELMEHGVEAEQRIIAELVAVADEVGVGYVATNDSHYIHADQSDAHDAWLAVGTKAKLTDEKRFRFHGAGYHLRTEAEMRALRPEPWWQRACDTTVEVAARVADDVMPSPKLRLPKFPVPEGFADAGTYLKHLVREGAFARYGTDEKRSAELGRPVLPAVVNGRLKFEFGVVDAAGLPDYFLIVNDIIGWARSDRGLPTKEHPLGEPGQKKPIRVGPGRGSAAGACLSYCLGIVGVDPLANSLLFERFLNPQRTGMPDIDVDFEQGRRPEVLRYIEARFGRDRVALIGTFGAALSRAAMKDAARVLDRTPLADRLSKLVPIGAGTGKPVPFKVLDDPTDKPSEAFRTAVEAAGVDAETMLRLARAFEGVTKQEGIHACGTLIADEPMAPLVPLRRNRGKGATEDDLLITVWDGKDVDAFGLLKMDVLGLRNLDVISTALEFIAADTGETIDPDALVPGSGDERDQRAWDLISSGRTAGVFQLESAGMTRLAEAVAPSSLADLTALVALYRPGPMAAGMHDHYAARKNGREPIDYAYLTTDPAEQAAIESVLGVTYGTIVYQEQLMQLSEVIGGLAPADRNKLQKAFSKKNAQMMAEVKTALFEGALAGQGTVGVRFSQETLDRLWATFEGAASYLFNASHACAYGFVSYQTAYLKANWPTQYGAALLACTDDDDKRHLAIRSLQVEGITILAPDINRSAVGTCPDGDAVRLGLSEVKGVGSNAVHIVAEREANGPFTSLADVLARVKAPGKDKAGRTVLGPLQSNKVEALIEAGAFDEFGPRYGQLIVARGLRPVPDLPIPDVEWGILELSAKQRIRLGTTTGEHPLTALKDQVVSYRHLGQKPLAVHRVEDCRDGERVLLLGVLAGWAQKSYRGGQMVTLTIEGSRNVVEGVMWDDDRRKLGHVPPIGSIVVVQARVRVRTVETERIDENGETVIDSFERRDLTVTTVRTVPVQDPGRVDPAVPAELVAPTVQPAGTDGPPEVPARASRKAPTPVATTTTKPAPAPALEAADDEWAFGDCVGNTPATDEGEHLASVTELRPVKAPVDVVRLPCASPARQHPALRRAITTYDLPAGFLTPGGGAWSLRTEHGDVVVVIVGEHDAPDAAHPLPEAAGWSPLPFRQSAAA